MVDPLKQKEIVKNLIFMAVVQLAMISNTELELIFYEMIVGLAPGGEFLMGADFDNPALIEYHDLVGMTNRTEAVGHNNHSFGALPVWPRFMAGLSGLDVAIKFLQVFYDGSFVVGIEGTLRSTYESLYFLRPP